MTAPHLKIVRIMRRRDLDRARTERLVNIGIGKERNPAVDNRKDQHLADHILVTPIFRMHGNARVAEHCFRACRRDLDEFSQLAVDRIAKMPEMAFLRLVLDLDVGNRRVAGRTPVRDARSLIDKSLLVEGDKDLAHGTAAALVHRKALAIPIER